MTKPLPPLPDQLRLMMGDRILLIGPPGTGKTTAIMGMVVHLLNQGWQPVDIAIVSFTRAAVGELKDRLRLYTGEGKWEGVSTLHSRAARLQGVNNFMTEKDWRKFNELTKYNLTPEKDGDRDVDPEMKTSTEDDKLRMIHSYARNRMISLTSAVNECSTRAPLNRVQEFAQALDLFKREHGLVDFTDVIESAVQSGMTITQPVIIVDESQDLSPLQIAFLRPAIEESSIAVVAGDDDQAIFEFQGASPAWIRSLNGAPGWQTHVLPQSWRCPAAVQRVAEAVALKLNDRVPKSYLPRPEEGECKYMGILSAIEDYCQNPEGSVMILCRGGKQCTSAVSELFHLGVPYLAERGGGYRPYNSESLIKALRVFFEFRKNGVVASSELSSAIDKYCTSKTKTATCGLITYGGKMALKRWSEDNGVVGIDDLIGMGFGDFVRQCQSDPLGCLQKEVKPEVIAYLASLVDPEGRLPEPKVTVTTWHTSKGREADTVIVWAQIPKPCADALLNPRHANAEHRAAYVAVTRAKKRVIICPADPGESAYPFPRIR